ncbi:hypothetical protein EII17_11450 [Clostridiales bacterium COT073_COT-073]|nr:hypothetical protein EII17_11450 [Clostridiales bacterium COT073_COT-073]
MSFFGGPFPVDMMIMDDIERERKKEQKKRESCLKEEILALKTEEREKKRKQAGSRLPQSSQQ